MCSPRSRARLLAELDERTARTTCACACAALVLALALGEVERAERARKRKQRRQLEELVIGERELLKCAERSGRRRRRGRGAWHVDARQRGELLAHEPQRLEPRKVRKLRRHAVEPAHVAHEHTQPLEPADRGRELATAAARLCMTATLVSSPGNNRN